MAGLSAAVCRRLSQVVLRTATQELSEDALVDATAQALGLAQRAVRVAVRYYAAYRDEIDEWIAANREAADEAEASWLAERELLRARGRAS
jgi:hypothetical protein